MSSGAFNSSIPPAESKPTPATVGATARADLPPIASPTAIQTIPLASQPQAAIAVPPARQLSERPVYEVFAIAEEIGLKPRRFKTVNQLIAAIHARRQVIASLSRDAMVDVLRWSGRPTPTGASKEALAHQIVTIRAMRFDGLSQRGLVVLGVLRGLDVSGDEPVPKLIRRLRRQEGVFARINRKRRSLLGSIVSNMIGGDAVVPEDGESPGVRSEVGGTQSIKNEIEESGLLGGLAGRIKKSADGYVNQKLDEIEARIDRKLDEIDRRLGEWRDKEVANRIRILKITLWASVIVGVFSMMYSYVRVYLR